MSAVNNDLFSIEKMTHDGDVIKVTLGVNANCEILKGHFPGQPVAPGACMLQITKEVLEEALKTTLRLKKADQLKFLAMIDPANVLTVELEISYKYQEDNSIAIAAKLSSPAAVYFKLQGSFVKS